MNNGRNLLNDCIDKLADLVYNNPILKEHLADIIKDLETVEDDFREVEDEKDELESNLDSITELYDDLKYDKFGGRF